MSFQILLNIGIAIIWMSLKNNFSGVEFAIGYFIGLLLLFAFRKFLVSEFYFRRVNAALYLMFLFIYKLTLSNIDVFKIVLSPKLNIQPGIIAIPTKLNTDWEITLLACLITLTPGTLSMNFSEDGKIIYVHSIHVPDKETAVKEIHDSFEKAILEVTK